MPDAGRSTAVVSLPPCCRTAPPSRRTVSLQRLPSGFAQAHAWEQYLKVSESVIVVRQASVADGEEIGEAHASAWEVAYVDLFEPDVLRQAAALRRKMWSQRLASSDFDFASLLVADQGGRVVGFCEFGKDREDTGRGEIFGFYLHPAAWGRGAATQLMAASLRGLANLGLDPVVVWTHPGAGRAQSFYVKSGFRATGRSRVETLGSGIDAPELEFVRVGSS
jgi:RimJ/RimL family protein N-acetyltransferase